MRTLKTMSPPEATRRLRADARRNQGQLLVAARDVFLERGPGAPLEEIARRAGVGIGTLYRRFADRRTLMRAVVVDALRRTAAAADQAERTAPDGVGALTSYLHAAVDLRVAAVIPTLLGQVQADDDAVEHARAALARIVARAHADGGLRAEVTAADVGMLLVRLCQPLPGDLERGAALRLAHRHVDLLLAGLLSGTCGDPATGGPAPSFPQPHRPAEDHG
jgi:AcrR family transcriptional regulator